MRRVHISLRNKPNSEHWRDLAVYWNLSAEARIRLEWIIFYYTIGEENATNTAEHFGISRKTFHKWHKRFDSTYIQSLEEKSRRPHTTRTWTVTIQEEKRIIALRTGKLKWGKKKLQVQYATTYQEHISTNKIQKVINKYDFYTDPEEHKKQAQKKRAGAKKTRIHEVDMDTITPGSLWHIDCIILNWYGVRPVIITGLEHYTKLGLARVYETHSSKNAADFLKRLVYLSNGDIQVIHHDNGSEFEGLFKKACTTLSIQQVYSRVRKPNDNAALERFNWTVQDEWLSLSKVGLDDIPEANTDLTRWLIEYNNDRPHQALDYLTPLQYAQHHYFNKVLPMWPASTRSISGMI